MNGRDDGILDLDRKRLELDVCRRDEEMEELEAARIERLLGREQEQQDRTADCEKSARVEIEKFCFIMKAFHGFQKE